jgi:hypothetical protein
MANIYEEKGYTDREDYLNNVADTYGVDFQTVKVLAETLGESEDFDGLINMVETAAEMESEGVDF